MIPVATEISPILGLTLLGMVEWIAIAILISVIVTGGFSFWSIRQSKAQVYKQLETQNKIASANLVIKYLKRWEEDEDFKQVIIKIEDANAEFSNKHDVTFVLAVFEDISVLRKDGTLTETHIREFFGRDIVRMRSNKSIMKIINEYHNKDPIHNYNNLVELINDSKDWGLNP